MKQKPYINELILRSARNRVRSLSAPDNILEYQIDKVFQDTVVSLSPHIFMPEERVSLITKIDRLFSALIMGSFSSLMSFFLGVVVSAIVGGLLLHLFDAPECYGPVQPVSKVTINDHAYIIDPHPGVN
jgi:hypothetical protein